MEKKNEHKEPPEPVTAAPEPSSRLLSAIPAGSQPQSRRHPAVAITLLVIFLGLGVALIAWWYASAATEVFDRRATSVAKRGALIEVVSVEGGLEPLEETPISTRIRGTIVYIPQEGKKVKKDELILQLDETDRVRKRNDRIDIIDRDMAGLYQQVQNIRKERIRTVMDQEQKSWQAELEHLKLGDLDIPDLNNLLKAREGYYYAQKNLEASNREMELLEQESVLPTIRGRDLANKRLGVLDAFISLVRSRISLERSRKGATLIDKRAQQLTMENKRTQLQKSQEQERTSYARQQQQIRNLKNSIADHVRRLERYNRDIKKMFYFSPIDGIVTVKMRWGNPWAAGRKTWQGSIPLSIPKAGGLKVVVRAADTKGLEPGMPAIVRSAAAGDQLLPGKIIRVSDQGEDEFAHFEGQTKDKLMGNADKIVYEVEVELLESPEVLRAGLSCEVFLLKIKGPAEIDLAKTDPRAFLEPVLNDAEPDIIRRIEKHAAQLGGATGVIVPRGALRRPPDAENSFVVVIGESGKLETRQVTVGAETLREVLVTDGLSGSEKVYMGPYSSGNSGKGRDENAETP